MIDTAYYTSFVVNIIFSVLSLIFFKRMADFNKIDRRKAKKMYSWVDFFVGIISGTIVFNGLCTVFELLGYELIFGHSPILLTVVVVNLMGSS